MPKKIIIDHNWKNEEDCNAEDVLVKEQEEAKQKKKKKVGRKNNPNFLPFAEARAFIQDEMLPSSGAYKEWWNKNKPKALPPYPYRVYKEWVSWNDFLGTNNKFQEPHQQSWRTLDEAIVFVHKLGFKSQAEWMTYAREGEKPKDIPARPDIVYNKWRSWNHWLGNKPQQAIEAKKEAQKTRLFYIIQYKDVPSNVFSFGVEDGGISGLKDRWEYEKSRGYGFNVVKMFWYDPDKSSQVQNIISTLTISYNDDDRQRIASNIHEVIWYLQFNLSEVQQR